jgi:hypothetical protein
MPRSAVRLLMPLELKAAGEQETRYGVLRDAVLSTDIVVASGASSMLESIELPARRIGLAGAACKSRHAPVRVAGLRIALRVPGPSAQSLARDLAFDVSAGVRAIALRALVDEHDALIDEAQHRLRNGRSSRERAIALDVLCGLGAPDAMALCAAVAADPAIAVRCVGYARRFAAASGRERDGLIVLVLRDPSPRVRRLAVAQVRKGASAPSAAALLELYGANQSAVASLVTVASHLSPWSRLEFLLRLVKSSTADSALAERLHHALDAWNVDMYRCFVVPAAGQVRAVCEHWTEAREMLPEDLRHALALHLRTFGILDAQ